MSDKRKKITSSYSFVGIFVLLLTFGLSLYTCSTKNLIGTVKVGFIFVNSNVPGAKISLDDTTTGKQTPDTLKNIVVGRHKISVRKDGYNSTPESDTVEVIEGKVVATITFSLTNQIGNISVDSDPKGAKIILDHKNTQKVTPDTLDSVTVGTHIVSVEKEGYRASPDYDTVVVVEDSLISVNFILSEKFGNIFVNSNISGAEIILDHVSTGKMAPDTIFDVMAGNHLVSVTKSGYSVFPDSAIVAVIESSVTQVNFVLSQNLGWLSVNSTPDSAEIYLNSQNSGEFTPHLFNLPEGSYVVLVDKFGYSSSPKSADIEVIKDSLVSVNFILTLKTGSIFVNSDPVGGNIILDHVSTGKMTPDTLFDVNDGNHIVSVAKDGYLPSPDSLVVTVDEGRISRVDFVLLDTLYGSLKVTSNVDGATICIDEKPDTTVTPHVFFNRIPIGTHIISIFKAGYSNDNPAKEIVNITTKDTVEAHFNLSLAEVGQEVGNITPDFELPDDSEPAVSHRLYAHRGFVTIINFWAKDCPPCMTELPHLQQIYTEYLPDSLIIFGINYGGKLGQEEFDIIRWVRQLKGITFTLLKGVGSSVKSDYGGLSSTPVTIILDRSGKIYYYKIGFEDESVATTFRQKLDELFDK